MEEDRSAFKILIGKSTGKPVGYAGLRVPCSPPDPRFAVSNPAKVDDFFRDVKILSTISPGRTLSWGS
jgi:hypothetical protein